MFGDSYSKTCLVRWVTGNLIREGAYLGPFYDKVLGAFLDIKIPHHVMMPNHQILTNHEESSK